MSGGLGRAKIFAVSGHVSPALDHLSDKLVLCELNSNTVQRRPALASLPRKRVAVMALLGLENESALPL